MSGLYSNKAKSSATRPLLNPDYSSYHSSRKTRLVLTASALAFFGTTCVYLSNHLPAIALNSNHNNKNNVQTEGFWKDTASQVVSPGISLDSFHYGLGQCQQTQERNEAVTNATRIRHRNPRAAPDATDILIRNGHVWLGESYLDAGEVYLKDGLIAAVGHNLQVPKETRILDAGGRVVTPGIIDMHSHMMVGALNGLDATDDVNEMTSPTTPYVCTVCILLRNCLVRANQNQIGSCCRCVESFGSWYQSYCQWRCNDFVGTSWFR